MLGENLSLATDALKAAGTSSSTVLIVGGGVTGLVTAWVLLDRGYHVTIVSKEWASWTKAQRLTSQIAGALWEYPPAVCGQHTDNVSLYNSKRWCMVAYQIWDTIASDPEMAALSGVRMRRSHFFFPNAVEDDPAQLQKMEEIQKSGIRGFIRDRHLLRVPDVNSAYGVVDAYEHLAPIIDTDRAMKWLMELVQAKGARLVTEYIRGDLFAQENALLERFGANVIVNATGLAGAETAGDKSCYPIRGALIRVINDGADFPKINQAMTITADAAHDANEIVFIVPRNDNILLLGGIAESHEWNLDHTIDTPIVKRMRKRCEAFFPQLKKARVDPEYPLVQGLRPFRGKNVRVERELRRKRVVWNGNMSKLIPSRIVHSYGQGGAGWSLSFGCAADVADLVAEALQDLDAVPMAMAEESMDDETSGVQQTYKARL
ncbi:FAD dependent oxidoreductase [Penicillium canescens]|nr:FAD dependent oxidoreductase [Penicillium canescens]KAJ6020252.1 FAD dependent oxidoreductase [Penicillium canescens]KAJ6045603.1 FAD dependent oxidoreductase [Penicillium canescens]KAJ6090829.1 FAD dependent oxidoreductase [Penicillium canescens]